MVSRKQQQQQQQREGQTSVRAERLSLSREKQSVHHGFLLPTLSLPTQLIRVKVQQQLRNKGHIHLTELNQGHKLGFKGLEKHKQPQKNRSEGLKHLEIKYSQILMGNCSELWGWGPGLDPPYVHLWRSQSRGPSSQSKAASLRRRGQFGGGWAEVRGRRKMIHGQVMRWGTTDGDKRQWFLSLGERKCGKAGWLNKWLTFHNRMSESCCF